MAAGIAEMLAINSAKLSAFLIKALKLGRGSSLPGRLALKLDPNILKDISKGLNNSSLQFFITGTNGKTTTTGILKQIIIEKQKREKAQAYVICNDMGANLYYGIVSEFVNSSDSFGKLKSSDYTLELDEASITAVAKVLKPSTIVVSNIYRDQLDRFGEIDSTQKLIASGIQESFTNNPHEEQILVLNADAPKVIELAEAKFLANVKARISYYAVESKNKIEDFDTKAGSEIGFEPDVKAIIISENTIIIKTKKEDSAPIHLNLPGLYNVYNVVAAAAAAYAQGISLEIIKTGIENYRGNFGRAEIKKYHGVEYQTFLIKNPTGATEVIKDLVLKPKPRYLIIINDNYADGRDVSWLWDAKFEYLKTHQKSIFCSGHRAEDMALRLKYAGVNPELITVESNIEAALKQATINIEKDEKLYVLPTYTALLEMNRY